MCTRVCICVCICMCVCARALGHLHYSLLHVSLLALQDTISSCSLFSLVPSSSFSILLLLMVLSLVLRHQPYLLFRLCIIFNPSTLVFSIHLHGSTLTLNSELQTHLSQGLLIILLSCLWASSVYHIQT